MSRPMVQEPIPPPQMNNGLIPETIIIEANRTISEIDNPGLNTRNHEWETLLAEPLKIKRGDEIRVSNVFANQVGADSGVISFNDANTDLQNNKTRIVYSFYCCDDGTNGKRKVIDMLGKTAGNTQKFLEFNTYNDMPLYRFQNNGLEFTHSDLLDATLGQFFGSGAEAKGLTNYLLFFNDTITYTENLIAPYEDRYLPGVFYNNIFLRTQNAFSSTGNYYRIQYDINMSQLLIRNNTGTSNLNNFIQPSMIVELVTDKGAIVTPTPISSKQFLDDYYFVDIVNVDGATPNNGYIGLSAISGRERGGQNWLNVINTEEGHTALSGQPDMKFNADPKFNSEVTVGTYVTDSSLGVSANIPKNTKIQSITSGASIPHNFTSIYGLGYAGQPKWRVQDITNAEVHFFAADATIFGSTNSRVIEITPDPTLNFPTLIPYDSEVIGATTANFVDNHNENYLFYNVEDTTPDTTLYCREDWSITDSSYKVGTAEIESTTKLPHIAGESFTSYIYVDDTTNVGMGTDYKYLITEQTPDITNPQYDLLPEVIQNVQVPSSVVLTGSPTGFTTGITFTILDTNGNSGIKEIFKDVAGRPVYNIELMTVTKVSGSGTVVAGTLVTICTASQDGQGNTLYRLQVNKVISGATPSTVFSFSNTHGANSGYLVFNRNLFLNDSLSLCTFTKEAGQFDAGYDSVGMTLFNSGKTLNSTITSITWNKTERLYDVTTSVALGIAGTVSGGTQTILQSNIFGAAPGGGKYVSFVENQTVDHVGDIKLSVLTFTDAYTQGYVAPNNKLQITITKVALNSGTITMSQNLTGNITPLSTITLNQEDITITLTNNLTGNITPDTPIYFTAFPSNADDPLTLDYHIRISPKGYSFTPNDLNGFHSMYGYTDEVRPKQGDRFSQYGYNRLENNTNPLETNITRLNKSQNKAVIPCIILEDPITNLTADGGYTENSIIDTGVATLISFADSTENGYANFTVNLANVVNYNKPGATGILSDTNPSTNPIFNLQRGVAFKLVNRITGDKEYLRIPNGTNEPTWSDSTAVYSGGSPSHLIVTGAARRFFESGIGGTGQYDSSTAIDWSSIPSGNIKVEIINITESYSEWNGKTNSPVNTHYLTGTTPQGNYTYGQSYIMIKDTIEEKTFIDPTIDQNGVPNQTYTTFNPLGVLGQGTYFYSGGYARGLATNYYTGSNARDKGEWVLHREFADIDLSAGGTNLSPSDIANLITEQTHQLRPAKINVSKDQRLNGFDFPESEGFGLPSNRFFIPIVVQPYKEYQTTASADSKIDGIEFVDHQGQHSGSSSTPSSIDGCFRFHNFYYNYKTITDMVLGVGQNQQPGFPSGVTFAKQSQITNPTMVPVYPRSTLSYVLTKTQFDTGTQSNGEYPVLLLGDTTKYAVSMSQFIGSNNVTAGFSANFNRIALSYLHQPYISASIISGDGADKVSVGGSQSVRYFYPYRTTQYDSTKPLGRPYWDRFGGINIECYAGNFIEPGNTYFDTIDQTNPLLKENYTLRNIGDLNPIGRRFWNKLGFSDTQLITKIGHTFSVSDTEGYLVLKGTTGQDIDSASGYISDVPTATSGSSQLSFPGTNGAPYPTIGDIPVWTQKTTVGGLTFLGANTASPFDVVNNTQAHTGYNAPNTSGEPLLADLSNKTGNQDNLKFTTDTGGQLPLVPAAGTDNPWTNVIGQFGFTIDAESNLLKADNLPIKTINSYYLLFCKELAGSNNFYTTSNRGNLAPECMAIISRLNTQSDFYFSYQSPISFFAKSDMLISRITTRITNADLSVPTTLGANSSVIYQIVRYNPKPPIIPPTMSQQQAEYVQTMDELDKQQRSTSKQGLSTVQQIVDAITEAALVPSDNQSDLISSIVERAQRMGILTVSARERRRMLEEDPEGNDLLTEIEELQTARQGVFTGTLSNITGVMGDPEEPQIEASEGGGVIIQPQPISDDLQNQMVQEAFNKRLAERAEFRGGVENIRERVERLGEIAENPLLQEYATRGGTEQRITVGGMRRGVDEEADIRRRRLQFAVDPTERVEGIEMRVDTQGNIRRAQARARARISRRQEEQRRELEQERADMRLQKPRRQYNPFSRNPEERQEPERGETVTINPRRTREAREERQTEAVRRLRQQTPEPEEEK